MYFNIIFIVIQFRIIADLVFDFFFDSWVILFLYFSLLCVS